MSLESAPDTETAPASTAEKQRSEEGELLLNIASQDMGRVILVRVMNLEGHSGVTATDGGGGYRYTPDNQQYPTQGDFAFAGDKAFDVAVTRGYPNHLGNIHLLDAHENDIVEPYPDDMPGVVYVKNGAEVTAKKVPLEIINENINRINNGQEPLTTNEVLDRLSSPK